MRSRLMILRLLYLEKFTIFMQKYKIYKRFNLQEIRDGVESMQ